MPNSTTHRCPSPPIVDAPETVPACQAVPVDLPAWAPVLVDPTDAALGLRGHRDSDVRDILDQCQDRTTREWTGVPDPYQRHHAEQFVRTRPVEWAAGRQLSFAVEFEGRFAGTVGLRPVPATAGAAAELGFGLAPWARGRGLAVRAVRILLAWAFDTLPLATVRWSALEGNWASRKVAWTLGFQVHGAVPALVEHHGSARTGWLGTLSCTAPRNPRHPWLAAPVLSGPGETGAARVVLRPHRAGDSDRIVQACTDPLTQYWLPQLPSPYGAEHAQAFLGECRDDHAAGRAVHWAVTRAGPGQLLGELGLYLREARDAEIGYWTHPDARGRRLMTGAVRLAARHALLPAEDGGLGRARVLVRASRSNVASQRVALAAGFRPSGVDRDAERLRDGTVLDMLRFDLVAAECP